jgi:hypothetical protein
MTPKRFAILAAAAALSLLAAIVVYGARGNWTAVTENAGKLFPSLRADADKIARATIVQGDKTLVLEKSGDQWLMRSHDGYPAASDKVHALLVALAEANLLEPKTQRPDRFALLEVDEPTAKASNARLIKLEDASGASLAEVIAGKRRLGNASAAAAAGEGTYVRRPGENQSWLASTTIAGGASLRDWAAQRVFETDGAKVSSLTVNIAGEQPYEIKRSADGAHELAAVPAGKKIKYVNMIDNIVEAAAFLDLEKVRKASGATGGEAGSVSFQTVDGLNITFKVRRDKDGAWATIDATGEGDARKMADEIQTRAKGWEFEVMPSKVDTMLKKQADLLEDAAS